VPDILIAIFLFWMDHQISVHYHYHMAAIFFAHVGMLGVGNGNSGKEMKPEVAPTA
jgi:mannose-6-phosphate isomerase-like protein (cupin superfamily)